MAGSYPAVLFSALYQRNELNGLNHMIILEDAEEAAYFHNDLEQLINPIDLFYFPSSFKTNKNFRIQSSSHVMLRTEALTRLAAGGNRKIIVTYPEALMEKVSTAESLSSNIISIKVNDRLDTDLVMERLVGYGFERADFVYEPGQFAMRGGIFDIYSFGNEKPYRVELFGQDVDSIRIFDPETQLSERKMLQSTSFPMQMPLMKVEKRLTSLIFCLKTQSFIHPIGNCSWIATAITRII
jgi:transcription-repair coupling factor (superfamily II helicase)